MYTTQLETHPDVFSSFWVCNSTLAYSSLEPGPRLNHFPMERLCRLAVEAGRGWQREQGQGMPGKCLYPLERCRGSFSRVGRCGAGKPRYPAEGGEWGAWATVGVEAEVLPTRECSDGASESSCNWGAGAAEVGGKTRLAEWLWALAPYTSPTSFFISSRELDSMRM